MDINPSIHHIKAHTNLEDEHSLGNAIADQLANDALDKFEKSNIGIFKILSIMDCLSRATTTTSPTQLRNFKNIVHVLR